MRFWNLSYDTFIRSDAEARAKHLTEDQVYTSPNGFKFVKTSVHEGILPMIETELLAARKRAKKQMAQATSELERSVYDGKQLALKVCCNSIYGFSGSTIGPIPMVPVSSSVTAIGREAIETSKNWIETNFGTTIHPEQGPGSAVCIYGDTDSVFIRFDTAKNVSEAIEWAQEIDKIINNVSIQTMPNGSQLRGIWELPMFLEYEKCFSPLILL